MPDPNLIICPECSAHHHEDLIRCPACHAFLIDANPWNSQDGLRAALFALIGTIGLIVFNGFIQTPLSVILADSISQAILLFGLFGIFLLSSRLRTIREQRAAFIKIRQITCDNKAITPAMIEDARIAVAGLGIASYNQALAFQRLRWLSAAASAPPAERQGVLEACRQHAEGDLDSVDNSFSRINFLVWLLPTAGFLGTVFGMTEALQSFARVVESGSDLSFNAGLTETARNLGVAFHTTLVGLAAVIPLLALATTVRSRTHTLLDAMNRYFLQLGSHLLYGIHEPKAPEPVAESPAEAWTRPIPPAIPEATAPPTLPNTPATPPRVSIWPTPATEDGTTPLLPALLSSQDASLCNQARYLMQTVGSLAEVGSFDPEQFQSVLKTTTGLVTIPAMVKTKEGASVLVYSWAAAWDQSARDTLNAWLQQVRNLDGVEGKVPVLVISQTAWPEDQPEPDVLQFLQMDLESDVSGEATTTAPAESTAEPQRDTPEA